jgi:hypothetical protein
MDFESEIKTALEKQGSLPLLREIVQPYKQCGGTPKKAYGTLEKIRQEYSDEPGEELILDLMDFVAGFCSIDQRIWDEILIN